MKSNKDEFINYLATVYGGFLDGERRKLWLKDVFEVLEESIDYTKFRLHFLHEFDTKTINNIPSPQWLYKESRQFLPNNKTAIEQTEKRLKEERELKGVPCPPEIRKQLQAFFSKENDLAF